MAIQIRKAARQKAKLRVGVSGPSGSGKTTAALLIAKGLSKGNMEKVAVLDTENGSAELYSHMGPYNVVTLDAPYTPERYIEIIQACEKAGMDVIIIDSVTHEWDGEGGCKQINEQIAASRFQGNSWAAWSVTTPRHQKFLNAITASKAHIITTVRSKTDTIQTEDKKIKKVGMADVQRDGYEYELTLSFSLERDKHYAIASKDRTGIFSERDPFFITEEVGKQLIEWSESGVEVDAPKVIVNKDQIEAEEKEKQNAILRGKKVGIMEKLKKIGFAPTTAEDVAAVIKLKTQLDLTPENYDEITNRLAVLVGEAQGK